MDPAELLATPDGRVAVELAVVLTAAAGTDDWAGLHATVRTIVDDDPDLAELLLAAFAHLLAATTTGLDHYTPGYKARLLRLET